MTETTVEKTIEERVLEILEENVVTPTVPVKIIIGEAGKLHRYITEDKEALMAKGLTQQQMDDLNPRAMYLQDKQSDWTAVFESALTNTKEWEEKVKEASLLQRELKHDFQFAFRNHPEALQKLKIITDGNGNIDLMQDMSDYPKLARQYPELLTPINFDNTKLNRADQLSHELYDLWQKVDGVKNSKNRPEKILRDRAYTYLKQLMDEIRAYGKYAFWNDEEKQRRYASEYLRQVREKNEAEKNTEE